MALIVQLNTQNRANGLGITQEKVHMFTVYFVAVRLVLAKTPRFGQKTNAPAKL